MAKGKCNGLMFLGCVFSTAVGMVEKKIEMNIKMAALYTEIMDEAKFDGLVAHIRLQYDDLELGQYCKLIGVLNELMSARIAKMQLPQEAEVASTSTPSVANDDASESEEEGSEDESEVEDDRPVEPERPGYKECRFCKAMVRKDNVPRHEASFACRRRSGRMN